MGPCSNRKIKNNEDFVQQSSHQHLTNHRRPCWSPYTWKPLIMLSVVCTSKMIGCATSLLCARQLGSVICEIKNYEKNCFQVFGANLCPRKNFNVYGTVGHNGSWYSPHMDSVNWPMVWAAHLMILHAYEPLGHSP